jgi:type IV secretory pathway VirB2 component (pilin)
MRRSVPIFSWRSALGTLAGLAASAPAWADDFGGGGPVLRAVRWMEDSLVGVMATTLVVLVVGVAALAALSGYLNWRRALAVMVGFFVLFGATAILAGIRAY